MHRLLSCLRNSPLVSGIKIFKFTLEEDIQRIYLQVSIKNGSVLYIRETRTLQFEDYSYHWQTRNGKLLARWDNAGHHKYLHHMHVKTKQNIKPAKKPDIKDVLEYINKRIR